MITSEVVVIGRFIALICLVVAVVVVLSRETSSILRELVVRVFVSLFAGTGMLMMGEGCLTYVDVKAEGLSGARVLMCDGVI